MPAAPGQEILGSWLPLSADSLLGGTPTDILGVRHLFGKCSAEAPMKMRQAMRSDPGGLGEQGTLG
jgi:hypothetical protein